MASPQVENGYTPIANEILEAIGRSGLPGQEQSILWILFRKTYGYHKKQDQISLSQWQQATGMSRADVCEAIKTLEQRQVIVVDRSGYVSRYSFQKDYERWNTPRTSTAHGTTPGGTSTLEGTKTSTAEGTKTSTVEGTYKIKKDKKDNASAKNADARAPLSRTNNLPPSDVQARVLFPAGSGNHTDAIREIERHGWHIRGADLLRVTAAFVDASGLPIPNATASRNGWLKDIRQHLEDFGVGVLEQAYPATVRKMQAEGLTISRPGSLTKTLPAVVATLRSKAPPRSFTTESIYDESLTEPVNEPQRKP